jgi:hypothetical protein
MHHGLIATAIGGLNERVSAPADRHESTVDAGLRPKRRRGNLSHQTDSNHGHRWAAEVLQRTRQRAVTGADFDNGFIGAIDGLHNRGNDAAIVKEVLAKLMPA